MLGYILMAVVSLSCAHQGDGEKDEAVVMISEEDGRAYLVDPDETLGEASERGALALASTEEEKGVCVQEELVKKPEGAVACKCYEHTECKGNESRECKRHCRRDLCKCCSI